MGRRALLLLLMACGARAPQLADPLKDVPVASDTDADPGVVSIKLVAEPSTTEYLAGKPADIWAYRDASATSATVPGPTIIAHQGDTVVVQLENRLPVQTTIHWHGIRLPNASDGTSSSQRPVMPGETYEYRFQVNDVGTFWYHPHMQASEQVEKGLYGALVVLGGTTPAVAADRTFVIDDVKIQADGKLSTDTDQLDMMMGRQGNVLLVNGQQGAAIAVGEGTRERWRFINAANGRFFNLALEGHSFLVIGWDGGLLPQPYRTDRLLITPGERYEVLIDFDRPSSGELWLQTWYYDRGHDMPDPGPQNVLQVVYGPKTTAAGALPDAWRDLQPTVVPSTTPVRTFALAEADMPDGPIFSINNRVWPYNDPVMVTQGDLEIWEIDNQAEMDHPFHIHGMFFEVQSVNGQPPEHFGWKDTVNVPMKSTVRLAVKYESLGMWMFHCHILEHADRGMMGDLHIMPP
jgi:FtsP/CotA-like multicopper oxidase with cupredoxin domain